MQKAIVFLYKMYLFCALNGFLYLLPCHTRRSWRRSCLIPFVVSSFSAHDGCWQMRSVFKVIQFRLRHQTLRKLVFMLTQTQCACQFALNDNKYPNLTISLSWIIVKQSRLDSNTHASFKKRHFTIHWKFTAKVWVCKCLLKRHVWFVFPRFRTFGGLLLN